MTLLKEQDNTPFPFATLMIVLGIIGILFKFGSCNGGIDEGRLTSKELTLMKGPELIPGTKRESAHYRFLTNEYLSPFYITGTAFSIVQNNGGLPPLEENDRLQVIFLNARQNDLDNPLEPVDVYGLTYSGKEYFSPGMLVPDNSNTANIFFVCGLILLPTGLVLKLKKAFTPSAT